MTIQENYFKPMSDCNVDITGAIDIHIHPAPDVLPRSQHYLDIARDARDSGMKAICLKPLGSFPTIQMSLVAEKLVPGIRVFGGIVLDNVVGGFNPQAVKMAIRMGARFVWMPMFDSRHSVERSRKADLQYRSKDKVILKKGLRIWDEDKNILPEVEEIIGLISKAGNVVLSTCHLSPEESIALVRLAKKKGVKHITVTHPSMSIINASIDQQKIMAEEGAYIEHVFSYCNPCDFNKDPREIVEAIKVVGAENCIISSDSGHVTMSKPVDAFRQWVTTLLWLGISKREIELMMRNNPAKLLELD